ncbi:MAG TPA: hypothetical protein VFV38_04620 [Ktedonobacteraceae bacterium]|nr:hypothetical protein [Ktedonobacteraceae bacterium]
MDNREFDEEADYIAGEDLNQREEVGSDDLEDEDDEGEVSDYFEQDDLESVKAWFEAIRERRAEEADALDEELSRATRDIKDFETELKRVLKWKELPHLDTMNGHIPDSTVDVERYRRLLRDKRDIARRRLRDLVRQDREDLEWIWKLERNQRLKDRRERESDEPTRREREPNKDRRPVSKSQQRAANWKANKGKS